MKVKVRIAVAVDSSGEWACCGWRGCDEAYAMSVASDAAGDPQAHYWIEAELDVPEAKTVRGEVVAS